ncbi:unnamed protein product [Adineta steineri]|uniref:Peptidase S54 rhomboid domain-containing protein n=1 Tax=Adineta steineri TaxID=433720 RepID=A0A813QN44_9BILA|nr:unnamed protein product [Adineta steineri]CAF0770261.1 unnamed protein product [Adineta steineri]
MAENGHHPQIRRHSTRKVRSQAAALLMQPRKSLSSPSSPINKGNLTGNSSRSRHLWNLAVESVLENEKEIPKSTSMNSSTVANEPIGWYNLTKRVMQLNASPILATAAAPALHKENWQQRRYNFLSKYSMFGGELKEEVVDQLGVNEQGTDIEQRPIIPVPQATTPGSMDSEALNVKRESILGMAVTGVRNLLSADDMPRAKSMHASTSFDEEEDEDEQSDKSSVCLKNIVLTDKNIQKDRPSIITEPIGIDEHDHVDTYPCTESTQTDNEVIPTPVIVTPRTNTSTNQQRLHNFAKIRPFNVIFSRFSRSNRQSIKAKQKQIVEIQESYRSHRPYFTYWVTFVQILVCIISLIVYGYAPLSSTQSNNSSIFEQPRSDLTMNPWFGPHPADLIRLGAKYTPCIRTHDEVKSRYEKQARLESMSGCCINSITGRCMQTLSEQCLPRSGLTWYRSALKSKNLKDYRNIVYPAVCGLTPETCTKKLFGNVPREDESSWSSTSVNSKIFKWSPSVIKWPICLEQDHHRIANNISLYPHMQCINIVRPCCTGVLGDCILTSKDDCRDRRGIFHQRAHLCSQVDCIQSVCGMLEFFVARLPDQVYRFWTVIFIHAGLIHLLITIIFQYTIMRPLEKLAGCIRVMIIYIVSGFVGSLASALFLRDSIQVGPGGGQFAILACYLSELFLGWRSLKKPWIPFFKIIICLCLLFTVGLLPLVDNYAQCFGFLIGFMLNMIVFPDVSYKKNVRHFVVVTASLAITIALFIVLITLFYTVPFKCASCKLFSCPFGKICNVEKRDLI